MDNMTVCMNELQHNFQFIEKVAKYFTGSVSDVKYYYVFYCTQCGLLIHLESPI